MINNHRKMESNMSNSKWYASGKDKADDALACLNQLKTNLTESTDKPLLEVIEQYTLELTNKSSAVPLILNRFNLDLSHCLINHKIVLSKDNQELVKKINQLSYIKYGY